MEIKAFVDTRSMSQTKPTVDISYDFDDLSCSEPAKAECTVRAISPKRRGGDKKGRNRVNGDY